MTARAVLAGILLAGALTGCGSDGPGGRSAPAVVRGQDSADVAGTEVPVAVPNGRFTFRVSEPLSTIPADATEDGERVTAPAGESYVGIGWAAVGEAPSFGLVLHGTEPGIATIAVRTGAAETEVADLGLASDEQANGAAWVRIPDDGPATLEVEYDGLAQVFDLASGERETGPADGFYGLPTTLTADCPEQGPGRGSRGWQHTVACDLGPITAVPYVAGQGWAADAGRTWLAFDLRLAPTSFRWSATGEPGAPAAQYRVDGQTGSISVGGTEAVALAESEPGAGGYAGTFAVDADTGDPAPLEVTRTWDLSRDGGSDVPDAPDSDTVELRLSLDLTD